MSARISKRFKSLVFFANQARDERRFEAAATLYAEALRLMPDKASIHVQCGHMFKEAGLMEPAEHHYFEALKLAPDDADLALQLGHFHKLRGQWALAKSAYARAAELRPDWALAASELDLVERQLALGRPRSEEVAAERDIRPNEWHVGFGGRTPSELDKLVPALAPRRYEDLVRPYEEGVAFRRLGHRESTFWGNRQVLRGVEAIRGVCISVKAIVQVEILLNGILVFRGGVHGGYPLHLDPSQGRLKKYVFNHWIDFSPFASGLHDLQIRCIDYDEGSMQASEHVVLAAPVSEADFPDSNFVINVDAESRHSIDAQVKARPSMVRAAERALFPEGVRAVLVTRTDQLGDMVASIPALLRLRELLPEAKIVGLFNYANGELARTLGILDDIIVIDFPDDPLERRRLMTLDAQERLREQLEPYQFDIALDLAQAGVSREVLRLSGAKFTYGTGGEDWPWLSSDYQSHTRDRWNRHDFTPHSTKVLGLVETLGTLLKTSAPILRRRDIDPSVLAEYGIGTGERFAVLHTGARIGFSRWPYYADLARLLLNNSDLRIVIITEDPDFRATLPAALLAESRLLLLDRRLPFDHFDALLSFATVVVGNDSGPKHLASLRGTNVVTIFSARINWQEWGQENVGVIISRKIPCAGCALLHDADECGRDFACITDIRVEEVFDAAMAYISPTMEASS